MKKTNTKSLVIMGMLTAILILFSFTPIGTIPINPVLHITLNTIPIALAAVALGWKGSLTMGILFGLMSFMQAAGVVLPSAMGTALFAVSPALTFVQCVVPRALDGLLTGLICQGTSKMFNQGASCFVTGFFAAFLNTVFFMSSLVLLFSKTEYVGGMIESLGNGNIFVFIIAAVGLNAVLEMIASTVITGVAGITLQKAKLINPPVTSAQAS